MQYSTNTLAALQMAVWASLDSLIPAGSFETKHTDKQNHVTFTCSTLLQCDVREKGTLTDSLTILTTDDVGKFNSSGFSAILARSHQFYGTPDKSCRGWARRMYFGKWITSGICEG